MIGVLFDDIICSSYPDMNCIENTGSVATLAAYLERMYGMIANLGSGIEITKLQILRFWSELTNIVIVNEEFEKNFLIEWSNRAMKIDAQHDSDNEDESDEEESEEAVV